MEIGRRCGIGAVVAAAGEYGERPRIYGTGDAALRMK